MRTLRAFPRLLAAGLAAMMTGAHAASDDDVIASATAAAPKSVAAGAAVAVIGADGAISIVRKGRNNFTCFPDNPMSPGIDPMCLDANAMLWLKALLAKQPPPEGKVGFVYMLMGGSDASNSDPYAGKPASGHSWVDTGPHVMLVNSPSTLKDYPDQAVDPDTSVPYVMWPGSPYAHLMIPVH